jgi:hypothetical protein
MTQPSSPIAARLAVETALTTVTSAPRAIGSAYLFKLATPAEVAQNPADLKKQPRCWVLFRDPVTDGEMENGSLITMHYVVQITRWYWMGSDLMKAEVKKTLERIDADTPRMRSALCASGALDSYTGSIEGVVATYPTGIDGALRPDGWRSVGPDPTPTTQPDDQRVLRCNDFFRASIDLAQPT